MDRTNRDIINAFVPNLPASYSPTRMNAGTFVGEVPGYTGLLTRNAAKGQLTDLNIPVWFPASANPAEPDVVTIQIQPYRDLSSFADVAAEDLYFATGGVQYSVTTVNPADPFVVPIPEALRPPGVWLVRYTVVSRDTGNDNTSVPQLLIVDGTAPYDRSGDRPPAPTLPAGAPNPIDQAYFQGQPNQTVNFPISYALADGKASDDLVEVYFGDSDTPIVIAGSTRNLIDPATPTTIPLPLSAVLAAQASGNFDLRYRLFDVAGNPSQESYRLRLPGLSQAPVPAGFQPALVDLAVPGDGLIHLNDVATNTGIIVRVPAFTNAQPTDQIIVTLTSVNGSIPLSLPVGTSVFPIPFQFGTANATTLYGAGPGDVAVTATYTVNRGGNTFPAVPLSTPFNLNLAVAGPNPNPIPPGPNGINVDLLPVVVEAIRPGGVFGPPNLLEAVDVNRDARARIPLWTAAVLPDAQLPFTITLNYGGRVYTQDVTAMPPGREVIFTIPFADILALGGPTQQAFYTVSRLGNPNPQRSVDTTVTVNSAILQMDAPVVRAPNTTTPITLVNCNSLLPINTGALRVFIPPSPYLSLNEPVNVTYVGAQGNNTGAPPTLPPIVQSFPVPNATALRLGFEVSLGSPAVLYNPVNANTGLLNSGSASVTVSTLYQGQPVSSLPYVVRVRGFRPGTAPAAYYCDGARIP